MSKKNIDMFDDKEFKEMKSSSILINTSRGGIINERALGNAIKNGIIAGAALDVYKEEPYYGPLVKFDNVILTPHIGSYAAETRVAMELDAVNNIIEGLKK